VLEKLLDRDKRISALVHNDDDDSLIHRLGH